jgi:thiamine biosynthesis lipoprotein
LNLSALAKGYAVDEITELLKNENIGRFMVEIGGEIKTRGGWKIGICVEKISRFTPANAWIF